MGRDWGRKCDKNYTSGCGQGISRYGKVGGEKAEKKG